MPILIGVIAAYLGGEPVSLTHVYICVVSLLGFMLLRIFVVQHGYFMTRLLAILSKTALSHLIYDKVVHFTFSRGAIQCVRTYHVDPLHISFPLSRGLK